MKFDMRLKLFCLVGLSILSVLAVGGISLASVIDEFARQAIIGTMIAAAVILLGCSILLLRSILNQLGADPIDIAKVSETIAQGDLTMNLREGGKTLVGAYAAMDAMQTKLAEMIQGIRSGANEVALSSDEVSQGNANLSQRTQEQASSLEEVASSMEEMTSTVNQNADNAQQANQLAIAAREQADKGGQVVNRAVAAMSEINASSRQIADIIGVIDEIAFQTNLLALNAAVEAARAGEQGRGFAVVASEVRNLAGRSATAAKEIKALIQDSLVKTQDGTKLVDESGKVLDQIVTSVKKVSDIVAEIAAASQEQSAGIGQVNKAVMQMDDMTQQNASLVEQAAAASEAMGAQAEELKALVDYFKLDSEVGQMAHKPAARGTVPQTNHAPVTRQLTAEGKSAAGDKQPAGHLPKLREEDDGSWQEF